MHVLWCCQHLNQRFLLRNSTFMILKMQITIFFFKKNNKQFNIFDLWSYWPIEKCQQLIIELTGMIDHCGWIPVVLSVYDSQTYAGNSTVVEHTIILNGEIPLRIIFDIYWFFSKLIKKSSAGVVGTKKSTKLNIQKKMSPL